MLGALRRAPNGSDTAVIKEIQNCAVWSNPTRPIAAKNNPG